MAQSKVTQVFLEIGVFLEFKTIFKLWVLCMAWTNIQNSDQNLFVKKNALMHTARPMKWIQLSFTSYRFIPSDLFLIFNFINWCN